MKRRISALIVTVVSALGLVATTAAPAQAAEGWVYVVVNNRVCGTDAVVRLIQGNVDKTSYTIQPDYGDNIIYPKVSLGVNNVLTLTAGCYQKRWWGWQQVSWSYLWPTIRPTSSNQTFWVG